MSIYKTYFDDVSLSLSIFIITSCKINSIDIMPLGGTTRTDHWPLYPLGLRCNPQDGLCEDKNNDVRTSKSLMVGWLWGGLFDYSVTPGPFF